jgi:hypothetical protein
MENFGESKNLEKGKFWKILENVVKICKNL